MALEAQGVRVFWSTSTAASTSTAVLVGQVRTFSGPGGAAADIDVSHLLSTAHEYIPGLPDDGDFSMSVWLNPSSGAEGHKALFDDRYARVKRKCVLQLNDSTVELNKTKLIFDAYCKTFVISGAVDGAIGADIGMRVAGPCTMTTSSSL